MITENRKTYIAAIKVVVLLGCIVFLVSCSSQKPPVAKTPPLYDTAKRQLAPEPVYNRLRWVHLPEVIPYKDNNKDKKKISKSQDSLEDRPMIFPIMNFDLKDGTLAEAAQMIGASASYRSYCDPSIADKRLSLNMLGTIHELANSISRLVDVEIIIDHSAREVRFMPLGVENKLRFFDNTVSEYEHR